MHCGVGSANRIGDSADRRLEAAGAVLNRLVEMLENGDADLAQGAVAHARLNFTPLGARAQLERLGRLEQRARPALAVANSAAVDRLPSLMLFLADVVTVAPNRLAGPRAVAAVEGGAGFPIELDAYDRGRDCTERAGIEGGGGHAAPPAIFSCGALSAAYPAPVGPCLRDRPTPAPARVDAAYTPRGCSALRRLEVCAPASGR